MYQTNDTKVIIHQGDFTLQGSTKLILAKNWCAGLLDLFEEKKRMYQHTSFW